MKITSKTKMKAFGRLKILLPLSEVALMDEIKKFSVPKRIKLLKVTQIGDISIDQVFHLWDCKDDEALLQLTLDIFLKNTWYKKILYKLLIWDEKSLPLIDFTRLIIYASEIVEITANHFKSCKTISTDTRVDDILKKYSGDQMDMIIRWCKLFPSYTVDQALKVGWYDIYLAFKSESKDINIQIEISQLKPKTT